MDIIEASGKNVDEAIHQALVRLGKRRDEVDITILQEPSRGIVGLGGREARVRVSVRPPLNNAIITPAMADAILGPASSDDPFVDAELYDDEEVEGEDEFDDFSDEEGEFEEHEETLVGLKEGELPPFASSAFGRGPQAAFPPAEPGAGTTDGAEFQDVDVPSREDVEITVDVLQHILQYMNIRANVQVRSTEPLTLNIQGFHENLGLLIGRRGETLASLQLLVNLIVSHRTKHRMRIIVDAENYRERRESNLRSLALRVAQQVRSYRRSIALEAMPPHERRIVHIALSESKDISTESIGEGDERRVVISLKRSAR